MSHCFTLVKKESNALVIKALRDRYIEDVVSEMVARATLAEQLSSDGSPTASRAQFSATNTTQPVDLIVVVVGWWTEAHAGQLDAVRRRLVDLLVVELEGITIDAHLVVSMALTITPSDETQAKEVPRCAQCDVLMRRGRGGTYGCPGCGTTLDPSGSFTRAE